MAWSWCPCFASASATAWQARADSAATKLASIALGVVLATAAPPPAVALEYNIAQVQQ